MKYYFLLFLFAHLTLCDHSSYITALDNLDFSAVRSDLFALMTDSQDFWPADGGHYGGLFIRLAWHCAGSYRTFDGRGGCDGGRIRFDPESSWDDNANLDMARKLLEPIKEKYGEGLSWGDLIILSGTVAIEEMGGPNLGFCAGRVDDVDGSDSLILGPGEEQESFSQCQVDGDCQVPFGATTIGLIYVNPAGPMGVPMPNASALQVRDTFGRMGLDDRETVALIGGGHAFGKAHGACPTPPCGDGKGPNTFTSGFEGPWTTTPSKWSNQYFTNLLDYEWELWTGPGGNPQWRTNQSLGLMMLTADIALISDDIYLPLVEEFAGDIAVLNETFAKVWYKLTTRDMGPVTRCAGPLVPEAQPFQNPLPAPVAEEDLPDFDAVSEDLVAVVDGKEGQFVQLAYQCSSSYRRTDHIGGCDGARIRFEPELSWPGNADVGATVALLQDIKDEYDNLSWADLIVLAGNVAIGSDLTFCPGRTDASNGEGHMVLKGQNVFNASKEEMRHDAELMGLTDDEFVLLSARFRSSDTMEANGYEGTWGTPEELSNEYLTTLLNEEWESHTSAGGLSQFKAAGKDLFMVQNDLNLLEDAGYKASVDKYAADNDMFVSDFQKAWTKLMNIDRFDGPVHNLCEMEEMEGTDIVDGTDMMEETDMESSSADEGDDDDSSAFLLASSMCLLALLQ